MGSHLLRVEPTTCDYNMGTITQNEHALSSLICDIYDSAASDRDFRSVLRSVSKATHCTAAELGVYDWIKGSIQSHTLVGAPDSASRAYTQHFYKVNPFPERTANKLQPGAVLLGSEVMPQREFLQTEFYNEFYRTYEWFSVTALCLEHSPIQGTMVALIRDQKSKQFSDQDKILFEILVDHLRRALSISRKIESLELRQSASHDVLNQLHLGVVILDSVGKVVFVNRLAETLCNDVTGIVLRSSGLVATRVSENTKLQRAISDAARAAKFIDKVSGDTIRISRSDSRNPLIATVVPITGRQATLVGEEPRVMVLIRDPKQGLADSSAVLQNIYGLSPTESLVALKIADGKSVSLCALELNHTINTSRNLLKRAFQKTGTKSQSELASLVMKSLQ